MKLGKLLGAGKTFFGGRDTVSYREDKQFYLPKFISPKNPFAPKPAEQNSANPPEVKKVFAPAATKVAAKTQKMPVFPAPKPVRATTWTEKLNPFRAPQPVEPAIMPAVQPEFSLDAVKVVHNDLSDADVEVVPMKSRSVAPVASPSGFLNEHQLNAV